VYELLGEASGIRLTWNELTEKVRERWKRTGKDFEAQCAEDEAAEKVAEGVSIAEAQPASRAGAKVFFASCAVCNLGVVVVRGPLMHCNNCGAEWHKETGRPLGEPSGEAVGGRWGIY
jgi:hypothetical protein